MSDLKENSVGQPTSSPKSKLKFLLEQVGQLLFALLIVFAIRSSVVEPFKIPSGSMIPTLFVGDFIFVNKFAYALKLPFSDLFGKAVNIVDRDPPKRGDVIVFLYPKDTGVHYIKRVIGLPGDRIRVQDKVLYINDQKMEQVEAPEVEKAKTLDEVGDPRYGLDHMRMLKENLVTTEHILLTDSNNDYTANFDEITVPAKQLFVMGDNRDFSNDSRFWGYVPFENIAGRAEVIWLSLWVNFENPSSSTFKPARIGTLLK